jgi:hypothetical protein
MEAVAGVLVVEVELPAGGEENEGPACPEESEGTSKTG